MSLNSAMVLALGDYRTRQRTIYFTRPELNQLLGLYSRHVIRGEWRDYAIDQRDSAALFSVFRHTHERPLYTVVKFAPGTGRGGDFALLSGPRCVANGATIAEVLRALQKCVPSMRAVELGAS